MSLVVQNAPLQFLPSAITQTEVTDTYLEEALLLYPEIKKEMIRAVCEELALPLTNKVLGFGRTVTEADMRNTDKMSIAAEKIQWTVMPWLRSLFNLTGPIVGSGANDTDMIIPLDQNWGAPGMVLMFQDGNGNFQNVILTSGPVSSSGGFNYTGKLVTSDPTLTFNSAAFAQANQPIGWTYDMVAACSDASVKSPFRTPAWLENYTTTSMIDQDICSTGIQSMLWIEGVDGSRCFQPWQEFQMFQNFMKSFEFKGWYSTTTVNNLTGVVNLTDSAGDQIRAGAGLFQQVDSLGNVAGYNVSVSGGILGYNNPANYDSFLTFLQNTIVDWSVQNGSFNGKDLDVWAGANAYMLLQRALKGFADESGGCCFTTDWETGDQYQYGVGYEFKQYNFAGFKLTLKKCNVFNDPSVQGYTATGTTTPWEAWKFVVMPDTTCDGTPLIQYYSRAGCGTSNAFIHKYIPGTIDPANPNSMIATSHRKGYNTFYMSEGVMILNDPGMMLVFKPTKVS